jgi:hypothetical protein
MSYIRSGTVLPSGKTSKAFVIGDRQALINLGADEKRDRCSISYTELILLLKTKNFEEVKLILAEKLGLEAEEAEYVGRGLWEEKEKGEWNHL